jgi:hypothetical protein
MRPFLRHAPVQLAEEKVKLVGFQAGDTLGEMGERFGEGGDEKPLDE